MADAALKTASRRASRSSPTTASARGSTTAGTSPGFRLVLGQIAGELDISVVPVREAIRRLEAEGLVTFEKNVGAQVALLHETEYTYTMETLALVEGAATAAVRARCSPPTTSTRARAVNREMIACLDDFIPHRFTQLNQEFHAVLFEECPNPHILDLVHRGWNRLDACCATPPSASSPAAPASRSTSTSRSSTLIETGADPLEIELAARRHRLATLDAFHAYQSRRTSSTLTATPDPTRRPRMAQHHIPENLPDAASSTSSTASSSTASPATTFDVLDPVSNETYVQAAAGQKEDIDLAVAAATRAFKRRPLAADEAARARPRAEPHRRRRRGAGCPPRRARDLRHRPADHPGARPGAARGRELPLLRRPDRRAGRRRLQGARPPAQLRQPQADRRRRASSRRGTPRSCWRAGSSPPRSPPAAPSC